MEYFLIGVSSAFFNIFLLFLSAFMEEFIFRFTIFRFLRRKGFLFAVLLSSLLFALMHLYGTISFISSFVFGILMAVYYEYSNSLIKTIILHTLHNTLIVGITYGGILPLLGK